jgi:hypothetical protein
MIVIKGLTGIARRMFREESQARHGFGPTGLAPDFFFRVCSLPVLDYPQRKRTMRWHREQDIRRTTARRTVRKQSFPVPNLGRAPRVGASLR